MYNIEISKKELDTIFISLRDSRERISQQIKKLRCSYLELPENLKFLWRDKDTYKKYTKDATQECMRQLKEIDKLEEKLEQILDVPRINPLN